MRKNKLLICAVSAIMLAAFGCGSSKDTVEDTITVVDSTVKNDSNKAELNTTISFEEKHNEIETDEERENKSFGAGLDQSHRCHPALSGIPLVGWQLVGGYCNTLYL